MVVYTFFLLETRKGNPIFTGRVGGSQNKNIPLLTKIFLHSNSKVTCRKSSIYNPESPEWNNAACEKKKDISYRFAHPEQKKKRKGAYHDLDTSSVHIWEVNKTSYE